MVTKKPSKQRKAIYQAPLHTKHKMLAAHLSKDARKIVGKRSLPVRKGDEVKVMKGKFKGTVGKISKVNIKRLKVYMENVKTKKVSGEEVAVPIRPCNLLIVNPAMDDGKRIKRKGVKNEAKKNVSA
ncbi:MAG: 50S ribosomal protein L24 [Candidatus Aenigmarchaeota archaeon]|nr:50S ribosomal protein L24 [Candidatus Aenigmarchaeota archaeon]